MTTLSEEECQSRFGGKQTTGTKKLLSGTLTHQEQVTDAALFPGKIYCALKKNINVNINHHEYQFPSMFALVTRFHLDDWQEKKQHSMKETTRDSHSVMRHFVKENYSMMNWLEY